MVVIAIIGLGVGAGIAYATIPDANGVVHLCIANDGNVRAIRSDGLIRDHSAGVVSTSELRTGIYRVTFTRDVTTCGVTVSESQYLGAGIIGVNGATTDPPDLSHRFLTVVQDAGTANSLVVGVRDASTRALVEGPFTISANCS